MANGSCPTCGRALDEPNRHLRFTVPEPVLGIPEAERPARTWGNDVLMQVQDIGAFVRIWYRSTRRRLQDYVWSVAVGEPGRSA